MIETEQERLKREYEADLQKLQGLRPIDDEFMRLDGYRSNVS